MTNWGRSIAAAGCCSLIFLLALSPALSEEPAKTPQETLPEKIAETTGRVPVLDAVTAATPRYQPIVWKQHDAHVRELQGNCARCHHDLRGMNATAGRCADCHTSAVEDMTLVEAWHGLCQECHLTGQLNGQKHGPVKCLGCHQERQ